jgi:hypothetical protein
MDTTGNKGGSETTWIEIDLKMNQLYYRRNANVIILI